MDCAFKLTVTRRKKGILAVADNANADLGMRECNTVNDACDRICLGDVLFKEFHSRGCVIENVPDDKRCSLRTACIINKKLLAALDNIACTDIITLGTRHHFHTCNGGD